MTMTAGILNTTGYAYAGYWNIPPLQTSSASRRLIETVIKSKTAIFNGRNIEFRNATRETSAIDIRRTIENKKEERTCFSTKRRIAS
jgi:hypothetical protein